MKPDPFASTPAIAVLHSLIQETVNLNSRIRIDSIGASVPEITPGEFELVRCFSSMGLHRIELIYQPAGCIKLSVPARG
jgi:hypothetical protein